MDKQERLLERPGEWSVRDGNFQRCTYSMAVQVPVRYLGEDLDGAVGSVHRVKLNTEYHRALAVEENNAADRAKQLAETSSRIGQQKHVPTRRGLLKLDNNLDLALKHICRSRILELGRSEFLLRDVGNGVAMLGERRLGLRSISDTVEAETNATSRVQGNSGVEDVLSGGPAIELVKG